MDRFLDFLQTRRSTGSVIFIDIPLPPDLLDGLKEIFPDMLTSHLRWNQGVLEQKWHVLESFLTLLTYDGEEGRDRMKKPYEDGTITMIQLYSFLDFPETIHGLTWDQVRNKFSKVHFRKEEWRAIPEAVVEQ